jgi:hypothetical protein
MNLTGEGTMAAEDIVLLRTGFTAIVPETSKGRCAIYYDDSRGGETRLQGAAEFALSRLRCLFYTIFVISLRDKPMLMVTHTSSTKMGKRKAEKAHTLFRAIPVELEGFVALYAPPPGATRVFKETVAPLWENLVKAGNINCGYIKSYVEESPEGLMKAHGHGIQKGLCTCICRWNMGLRPIQRMD